MAGEHIGLPATREQHSLTLDTGASLPTITPDLLALAELLPAHLPLRPSRERIDRDCFTALVHRLPDPYRNLVLRVRVTPEEVEATVAEVRALDSADGTVLDFAEKPASGASGGPVDCPRKSLSLAGVTRGCVARSTNLANP